MKHTILGPRGTITAEWVSRGRVPECPPDPAFPKGRHIDCSTTHPTCTISLPYVEGKCGLYIVACDGCKTRNLITTAGRPDDPRSLRMSCRREGMQ